MRKKIIAGNWKMNKTPKEALELVHNLKNKVDTDKADVVFCVPAIDIIPVVDALKGTNISVGAQNMHFKDNGAFTGEISAVMLIEAGVIYVIIVHSDRRQYFNETDETVNKKALHAIEKGLTPIICVGETLEQREKAITVDFVRIQVRSALKDVSAEQARHVVIAYEPIWAIGTGVTATSEQAQEVCAAIREVIGEIYNDDVADEVRIQYGGSVNGSNAAELFSMPDIDGGLVGGASLKDDFGGIVNY